MELKATEDQINHKPFQHISRLGNLFYDFVASIPSGKGYALINLDFKTFVPVYIIDIYVCSSEEQLENRTEQMLPMMGGWAGPR